MFRSVIGLIAALCCYTCACGQQQSAHFFSAPARQPAYNIVAGKGIYEGNWKGRKYEVWPAAGTMWWQMYEAVHQARDLPRSGPWHFNWVVRRNPAWFVSGDLPRFSLVQTDRISELNPHFNMLGDVRIRYTVAGKSYWLDEQGATSVRFYPWGTVHKVAIAESGLAVEVEGLLVENNAIAVTVTTTVLKPLPADAQIAITVGGADLKFINFFPEYFTIAPGEEENDTLRLHGKSVYLKDPAVKYGAVATCDGNDTLRIIKNTADIKQRAVFSKTLVAGTTTMRLLLRKSEDEKGKDAGAEITDPLIAAAKQYYNDLLDDYEIHTPDSILNAGFYASILNMDDTYAAPGWLEGIHEWNSYFSNNYHISAAISLGQIARAKEAILYFGNREEGPGYVFNADGSRNKDTETRSEEGLPYYILQLWQYWKATGDNATLAKVWEGTRRNFETMALVRDPEGNGLLNWHYGANAFLYQADHLQLIGEAASPSLMFCGLLAMMQEMALQQQDTARAEIWTKQLEHARSEIIRRLWIPAEGRFAAAVTPDGLVQQASYYTDYVFGQLYAGMPAAYNWLSLRACDQRLWINDHLMRAGDYKPDLFGNNAVMPTQMAEAAAAYFGAGRSEKGWALLHGAALGATILTDSPGSFPEFNSNTGWGLPDYAFSNPAAMYARALVSGLFGLERQPPDQPLHWRPAIPATWDKASLRVKDIAMSVTSKGQHRSYELTCSQPQRLVCNIPLEGKAVNRVMAGDQQITYRIISSTVGGEVEITLPPATQHTFEIQFENDSRNWQPPMQITGQRISWTLPGDGYSIKDPQQVFSTFRIDGRLFTGIPAKHSGRKVFFLAGSNGLTACELDFGNNQPPPAERVILKGIRENISLDKQFNSDFILGKNFWRLGQHTFDFSGLLKDTVNGSGQLSIGDSRFVVKTSGQNMLVLEVGASDGYTNKLILSTRPEKASFNINKKIAGLEFLVAAECQIRLTDMPIGVITLYYKDGFTEKVPLVYGDNIDCMMLSFAKHVTVRKLDFAKHVAAFAIKTDSRRLLEQFEIALSVPDANVGIFGINLITAAVK